MSIIQDEDKVLLIGSQHVYRVDLLDKSVKCIYDGPSVDAGVKVDDSGSESASEEEQRTKKKKKSTRQSVLGWTGIGAVSGEHLILCDSLKGLYLMSIKGGEHLELLSKTRLEKAATVVAIHTLRREECVKEVEAEKDSAAVYIADKFGEVWTCPLKGLLSKKTDALSVIAGHISLLTDMIVNDGFILTCDRDEKIRITLRDRPWIIDQFLLEHKEYVSRMAILSTEYLVTGGGDRELMLWHWKPGKFTGLREGDAGYEGEEAASRATLVEQVALCSGEEDQVDVIGMAVDGDVVSVVLENRPTILHFQLIDGHLRRMGDTKLECLPTYIAYARDGLLVCLENGALISYQKGSATPYELFRIPDPFARKCSHLRKTVHRLTDD